MKELGAILWLDWRLVRRDLLACAVLVLVLPLLLGRSEEAAVLALALGVFVLPLAAALLGCTLSAGDAGLPLLRARPVAWPFVVALRLAHRGVLVAALAALGFVSLGLVSPGGATGDRSALAVLVPLVGVLACAATASALSRQAIIAALAGLVAFPAASGVVAAVTGLGTWNVRTALIVTLVAVPIALRTLGARTGESPVPRLRWALRTGAGFLAFGLVVVVPLTLLVSWRVEKAEAAWAWLPPAPAPERLGPARAASRAVA